MPRALFFDIETTGREPSMDYVLEIGAVAVDDDLRTLGTFQRIIPFSKGELDHALSHSPKVRAMHEASGLCRDAIALHEKHGGVYSEHIRRATGDLTDFLVDMQYLREDVVLSGHSIHFDLGFVQADMHALRPMLHYRLFDIGAVRDFLERCGVSPSILPKRPEMPHRALPDALLELEEARGVQVAVMRQPWCPQKMVESAFVQRGE